MKKINKTTTALSVAAAIVLSACGGDKTETPVENPVEAPVDHQWSCKGVQNYANERAVEILATCKDLDGILVDSGKVTIGQKSYDLTSIKPENIVKDTEESSRVKRLAIGYRFTYRVYW